MKMLYLLILSILCYHASSVLYILPEYPRAKYGDKITFSVAEMECHHYFKSISLLLYDDNRPITIAERSSSGDLIYRLNFWNHYFSIQEKNISVHRIDNNIKRSRIILEIRSINYENFYEKLVSNVIDIEYKISKRYRPDPVIIGNRILFELNDPHLFLKAGFQPMVGFCRPDYWRCTMSKLTSQDCDQLSWISVFPAFTFELYGSKLKITGNVTELVGRSIIIGYRNLAISTPIVKHGELFAFKKRENQTIFFDTHSSVKSITIYLLPESSGLETLVCSCELGYDCINNDSKLTSACGRTSITFASNSTKGILVFTSEYTRSVTTARSTSFYIDEERIGLVQV